MPRRRRQPPVPPPSQGESRHEQAHCPRPPSPGWKRGARQRLTRRSRQSRSAERGPAADPDSSRRATDFTPWRASAWTPPTAPLRVPATPCRSSSSAKNPHHHVRPERSRVPIGTQRRCAARRRLAAGTGGCTRSPRRRRRPPVTGRQRAVAARQRRLSRQPAPARRRGRVRCPAAPAAGAPAGRGRHRDRHRRLGAGQPDEHDAAARYGPSCACRR